MDASLAVAGVISLAMAAGHATIGVRRVLPSLASPAGAARSTRTMITITWHIVTIFAISSGGVLLTLALSESADTRLIILREFAAMWAAATVMAFWVARPRSRSASRDCSWTAPSPSARRRPPADAPDRRGHHAG